MFVARVAPDTNHPTTINHTPPRGGEGKQKMKRRKRGCTQKLGIENEHTSHAPQQLHGLVEILLALFGHQRPRAGAREAHGPRRNGAALGALHVLQLVPHAEKQMRMLVGDILIRLHERCNEGWLSQVDQGEGWLGRGMRPGLQHTGSWDRSYNRAYAFVQQTAASSPGRAERGMGCEPKKEQQRQVAKQCVNIVFSM